MPQPKILYVSFDQVPAPKGASTHILAFVKALGIEFAAEEDNTSTADRGAIQGNVVLVTPAATDKPLRQLATGVQQLQFGCAEDNPLGRAKIFREKLAILLKRQPFNVIHFRSIFEGMVVINPSLNRGAKLIYEANGFPSIEMKYHYPQLAGETPLLQKLADQEIQCLSAADQLITVSKVNRDFIEHRLGVEQPIAVIPNGFEPADFRGRQPQPVNNGPIRIAYIGTLSHWQGLETLLEAVEMVRHEKPCLLTIAGPASRRRQLALKKIISRLGIENSVSQQTAYSPSQICGLLHQSHLTVVPLLAVDRNTQQGCCPLKMIEAMASGCPVIASNLPVIQELGRPDIDYLPAKSGDARNLKNLILQLSADHELALRLSRHARQHVQENFTWAHATDRLLGIYQTLLR